MKDKFEGMKAYFKDAAEKTVKSVSTFVEHEDTKAAVAWTKKAITTATDQTVELGKRAVRSELGKDAATGAAIGAAVAVPIPLIGPVFGAVVGAGAGLAIGLMSGESKRTDGSDHQAAPNAPEIDIHKRLIDLDDLRQKSILSQEEFEVEKNKVLGKLPDRR